MKKTLKTILAIVAGAAAITACQKENLIEGETPQQAVSELKPMTFTAYMEGQDPATKTTIDASHYALDQLYDVIWSTEDKIGVYDGATENNGCQEFTLNSGAGSANAEFIGEAAEAQTYYAIYPYVPFTREEKEVNINDIETKFKELAPDRAQEFEMFKHDLDFFIECDLEMFLEMYREMGDPSEIIDELSNIVRRYDINDEAFVNMLFAYATREKVIIQSGIQRDGDLFKEVVIPAEQTVSEGQCVDPKAMLMIAKSDNSSSLSFKNVCAYVRVTPQFDCYAICIRSNSYGNLAGKVTLDYYNGEPRTEVTQNGSSEVCLTGSITSGNTYYIAVRPETTGGGFTIEFLTKDKSHYYGRSSENNLGLVRSEVVNLGEFSTGGAWTYNVPTTGNDGKGHNWRLITPTLKLATEAASYSISGSMVIEESVDENWGEGWAFPSKGDLTPIAWGKGHTKAQVYGLGILKYVEPQITISAVNTSIWLSGTAPYGNDTVRNIYDFDNAEFGVGYIVARFTHSNGLYYKYTK